MSTKTGDFSPSFASNAEPQLREIGRHQGAVLSVALTADGEVAVSGSEDRRLVVWNTRNGALVDTLPGHLGAVSGVAVDAGGRLAVSVSEELCRSADRFSVPPNARGPGLGLRLVCTLQ